MIRHEGGMPGGRVGIGNGVFVKVAMKVIKLPTVMFFKRPPCPVATLSTVAVSAQLTD